MKALRPAPAGRVRPIHQVLAVSHKELRHLLRSPRDLALVLVVPPVLTLLFGTAFEVGEVKHVPVAVVDEDRSPLSGRILAAMEADDAFRVTRAALTPGEARSALDGDRVVAVVRLPRGLEASARAGQATIGVDVSGIDPDTGPTAIQALTAIVVREDMGLAAARLAVIGLDGPEVRRILAPVATDVRVHHNPRFLFLRYVMPGILGLVLQLVTMGLLAGTLTREKEQGTLEAMLARPVGPLSILAGKALPYAAVSAVDVAAMLAVAAGVFGVPLGRGALPALIVTGAFVASVMALAVLLSSVARTQTQSLQWTIYYTLPAFLLSGAIAPTAVMPEAVRRLGLAFPLTFFCHAFRDVSLKELPVQATAGDLGAMALHAAVALAGARLAHRRWLSS